MTVLFSLELPYSLCVGKLAEKAGISCLHSVAIEAPNVAKTFSIEVFYDIANASEVNLSGFTTASVFPDHTINRDK